MLTVQNDDAAPFMLRWQDTLLGWVRDNRPDLTNRQMAIMMIVGVEPEQQTVRGLAGRLNVHKAVISRALDRLGELDYLSRSVDRRDRRNIFIVLTEPGREFLNSFTAIAHLQH